MSTFKSIPFHLESSRSSGIINLSAISYWEIFRVSVIQIGHDKKSKGRKERKGWRRLEDSAAYLQLPVRSSDFTAARSSASTAAALPPPPLPGKSFLWPSRTCPTGVSPSSLIEIDQPPRVKNAEENTKRREENRREEK
ncbi:unnamed protein product [Linum trigynum]|uniref:Uncharacterized protein n=1 Tax=Linum trigynum TaxID=586398 RepID=A0AAV2FP49_9ROSI